MIGKTISRYKITEKIGEGGMGSVWRAEDPLLGRDIALKFLPESLASSSDARKRFLREAKSASALRHPSIAAVFDAGEEAGRIYIAFELVDGETVSERISQGALDIGNACRVAFDAAEALDHAHESGVVHRDVTSRNIMIDKKGRVIVVDFGLALPMGATRVTQEGSTVGTAPYLAPEVVTGGDGDARSDVYGLGVVLYEALTGKLPFEADRVDSLFYLVVHTDAEPPSAKREGIPAELDRVVMKALAKDPAERYASAREFAKDLYAYLATASDRPPSDRWLTAPVPSVRPQPIPQRLKRVATKPVTWVVMLVVVAAVVYGITKLTPEPEPAPGPAFASVAVLPFQNLTGEVGEGDWLAEGIAEALATKLTSVSGVRVTPWLTSRNFRDLSRSFSDIAEDLNVETLVVGTVRQRGERVLCTISVVDSKTESQWWADEYKEPLDDLFEVQERIALGVARSLKGKLSGTEEEALSQPAAANVEAYEHYLRGSAAMQLGTAEALGVALPYFERAIALDPDFADAYVGIGAVHSNRFFNAWGGWKTLGTAEEMFRRALELDPKSIAARRGLSRVSWQLGRSEDVLKAGWDALRANPEGVENLLAMGEAYYLGGLSGKAIPVLKRVIELDPSSEAAHWFLTISYLWDGRSQSTIEMGERYFNKFGEDPEMYLWVGVAYHQQGDLDVAQIYYKRSMELYGDASGGYFWHFPGRLYLELGDEEEAQRYISQGISVIERQLESYPDQFNMRMYLAALYGLNGDVSRLWEEFDKAAFKHSYATVYVVIALACAGEVASAVSLLESLEREGCNLADDIGVNAALFPDGFLDRPEVQSAVHALERLQDDLASRY